MSAPKSIRYHKVWFSNGAERTSGLVIDSTRLATMSVSDISRLFPMSESHRMRKLHVSPPFATWDTAFGYVP